MAASSAAPPAKPPNSATPPCSPTAAAASAAVSAAGKNTPPSAPSNASTSKNAAPPATPRPRTPTKSSASPANGDPLALSVLEETAGYLGIGFANINAVFNPEAIVVGDYLASGWDLMKDWVWNALRSRAPLRQLRLLRILPSRHGADSTLLGTVALVLSSFFASSAESRPAA
jgi:predicted NBD/HSP70 family sugar kinase